MRMVAMVVSMAMGAQVVRGQMMVLRACGRRQGVGGSHCDIIAISETTIG